MAEKCPFCDRTLKAAGELHDCAGTKPGAKDRLDERIEQTPPEPQVSLREDGDDGLPPAA